MYVARCISMGVLNWGAGMDSSSSWLKKVAAVDGFDLPILSPEFRAAFFSPSAKRKLPITGGVRVKKTHRSDDGLKGTRHLTVEQRHALLEPLGHFNFEEFSQNYPTVCEADYRLSLARECTEDTEDMDSDSSYYSEDSEDIEDSLDSDNDSLDSDNGSLDDDDDNIDNDNDNDNDTDNDFGN